MPRRQEIKKRPIDPDPRFNDRLVTRLVCTLMRNGKKTLAERVVYGAFDIVAERMKDDPVKVFKRALENTRPLVETKSRRVGGANYQVPIEVKQPRGEAIALRWLVSYAKERPGKSMVERLAGELMDAHGSRGAAIKKREDVHRMAEANKAFAHFRW